MPENKTDRSDSPDSLECSASVPVEPARHPAESYEAALTETMVDELAAHAGVAQLTNKLALMRAGDIAAYRVFSALSITVSRSDFSRAWCGTTSVGDLTNALTLELRLATSKPPTRGNRRDMGAINSVITDVLRPIIAPKNTRLHQPFPAWRSIAKKAELPNDALTRTDKEVLNMVERVLIRGQGWGPNDPNRGQERDIHLLPSRMSQHGLKRDPRTYQRSYSNLVQLGLLQITRVHPDRSRSYAPTWWILGDVEAALDVWRGAAARSVELRCMSHSRRTICAPMTQQCRTSGAPPVHALGHASPPEVNQLTPSWMRHAPGRLTLEHFNTTPTRAIDIDGRHGRDAPRLPDGQARRADESSGGALDDPKK